MHAAQHTDVVPISQATAPPAGTLTSCKRSRSSQEQPRGTGPRYLTAAGGGPAQVGDRHDVMDLNHYLILSSPGKRLSAGHRGEDPSARGVTVNFRGLIHEGTSVLSHFCLPRRTSGHWLSYQAPRPSRGLRGTRLSLGRTVRLLNA